MKTNSISLLKKYCIESIPSLAKLIPQNRIQGFINVYKYYFYSVPYPHRLFKNPALYSRKSKSTDEGIHSTDEEKHSIDGDEQRPDEGKHSTDEENHSTDEG